MKHNTDEWLLRAVLNELSDSERREHDARLAADAGYRAAFAETLSVREQLDEIDAPTLAPGLDVRVMARLRRARAADPVVIAMSRQFWRLAVPATAAAALVLAIAVRTTSSAGPAAQPTTQAATQVTLATWYPISVDPTAQR